MQMLAWIGAALFPARCTVCGTLDPAPACAPCTARIVSMGSPPPVRARSCRMQAGFPYQWPVRELVIAGKRPGGQAGLRLLATLAAERMAGSSARLPEVIVPVPLWWRRQRRRGFNQAAVIAEAFATTLAVPAAALLERRLDTGTQVGRGPGQRATGLRDAFCVRAQPPARVWLVDDVLTTGATLAEAALALRGAGAREVTGCALAAAEGWEALGQGRNSGL